MKDHYPEVWERLKKAVAEGTIVPVGGMWVESDTNLPGGEALARQFVHGKRFFLDEYGIDTQEVWLPDSFGYTAALPQLVKLSGSKWFLTQKISWNQKNKFPHHTFWWEGLDGTRVFTHFPPIDTYNSDLSGRELAHAQRNFAENGAATRSLVPFGYGDGGGGPTREFIATARRVANLESSPRVTIESPTEFFSAAAGGVPETRRSGPVSSTWRSTARRTPRRPRPSRATGAASTCSARPSCGRAAAVVAGKLDSYPYDDLDRIWKAVLLNQFHDILPGSSIAWVHREAEATYARLAEELSAIIAQGPAGAGRRGIGADRLQRRTARPRAAWPASARVSPPARARSATIDGRRPRQRPDPGHRRRARPDHLRCTTSRPQPRGDRAGRTRQPAAAARGHPEPCGTPGTSTRSTRTTSATSPRSTASTSADRGRGRHRRREAVLQPVHASPRRCGCGPGAKRVDIETEMDWHESEKFLKAAFPVDVHADRSASETQFGHIFRPTHQNTSWDAAKFEIAAHRWVHVGEPGYGVAVVNDSTYGHDVNRTAREDGGTTTTIRTSLIRAPRFPDPQTDQGVHVVNHALVVGAGIPEAIEEGYRINLPERVVSGAAGVDPIVAVDNGNVIVEAVKLADDQSGDVVVRLYESSRRPRPRHRSPPASRPASVTEVDLLERRLADRDLKDNGVTFELRPFQILTLRFKRS